MAFASDHGRTDIVKRHSEILKHHTLPRSSMGRPSNGRYRRWVKPGCFRPLAAIGRIGCALEDTRSSPSSSGSPLRGGHIRIGAKADVDGCSSRRRICGKFPTTWAITRLPLVCDFPLPPAWDRRHLTRSPACL